MILASNFNQSALVSPTKQLMAKQLMMDGGPGASFPSLGMDSELESSFGMRNTSFLLCIGIAWLSHGILESM